MVVVVVVAVVVVVVLVRVVVLVVAGASFEAVSAAVPYTTRPLIRHLYVSLGYSSTPE